MKKSVRNHSEEEYFEEYSQKALQKGGGTFEGAMHGSIATDHPTGPLQKELMAG
jgi:hypothetical protein